MREESCICTSTFQESHAIEEAIDDKLAELRRERREVCGETRNAHDEIRVRHWIGIRLEQRLLVEHVDVDQRSSKVEVRLD